MLRKLCVWLILGLEGGVCYVNPAANGLELVLLETFEPLGFLMCSSRCTIMGSCHSFQFNMISFRCRLLRGQVVQAETSRDVIMVCKWMIQALYAPCPSNSCGVSDICILDALGRGKCVDANNVCGAPPNMLQFEREFEGRYLHARANYTCTTDHRPCGGTSTSVCRKGGEWSRISLKCGRFRWHNPRVPFDKSLPCGEQRTVLINVKGTPVNKRFGLILATLHRTQIVDISTQWGLFGMKIHGNPEQSRKPLNLRKVSNMTLSLRDNEFELSVNGIWFASMKEKRFMKPGRLSIRKMKLEQVEIHE